MKRILEIQRRATPSGEPYYQSFSFETEDNLATIATALTELNKQEQLVDILGNEADEIQWECSCLQRKCGACAMLIDGKPQLACDVRLADLTDEVVHLAPLSKFPVVTDLRVDRSSVFSGLERLGTWLEEEAIHIERNEPIATEASRCMQCACCLEVCPNFSSVSTFRGMSAMVAMSRLLAELGSGKQTASSQELKRLREAYTEVLYGGCGKSLACRDICPAHLDIEKIVSRSNAAAVWGRL